MDKKSSEVSDAPAPAHQSVRRQARLYNDRVKMNETESVRHENKDALGHQALAEHDVWRLLSKCSSRFGSNEPAYHQRQWKRGWVAWGHESRRYHIRPTNCTVVVIPDFVRYFF